MVCVLTAGKPGKALSASAVDGMVAMLECPNCSQTVLYEDMEKLDRHNVAHDPRRPVESYFSSVRNGGLPWAYLSNIYRIKCDDTDLTSAVPGVF